MTKSLTEKWKDGELPDGWYYAKTIRHEKIRFYLSRFGCLWYDSCNPIYAQEDVEVLAPVPSYKTWKKIIDGDIGTLEHLKKILPMIEYNRVAYDYLKKVIEDMEQDIKEIDNEYINSR